MGTVVSNSPVGCKYHNLNENLRQLKCINNANFSTIPRFFFFQIIEGTNGLSGSQFLRRFLVAPKSFFK